MDFFFCYLSSSTVCNPLAPKQYLSAQIVAQPTIFTTFRCCHLWFQEHWAGNMKKRFPGTWTVLLMRRGVAVLSEFQVSPASFTAFVCVCACDLQAPLPAWANSRVYPYPAFRGILVLDMRWDYGYCLSDQNLIYCDEHRVEVEGRSVSVLHWQNRLCMLTWVAQSFPCCPICQSGCYNSLNCKRQIQNFSFTHSPGFTEHLFCGFFSQFRE